MLTAGDMSPPVVREDQKLYLHDFCFTLVKTSSLIRSERGPLDKT
jgi:hypothetical protein